MEPIIFTGKVGNISIEDSGYAQIADLDDLMDALKGKRVRITVEVLDEVNENE